MNLKNYSFFAIFNTFIGISFISFYLYLGVNFDTTIILAIISTDSFKLLIFSKLIFKKKLTIKILVKFVSVSLLLLLISETFRYLFGSDLMLISFKFLIIILLGYLLHNRYVFK